MIYLPRVLYQIRHLGREKLSLRVRVCRLARYQSWKCGWADGWLVMVTNYFAKLFQLTFNLTDIVFYVSFMCWRYSLKLLYRIILWVWKLFSTTKFKSILNEVEWDRNLNFIITFNMLANISTFYVSNCSSSVII